MFIMIYQKNLQNKKNNYFLIEFIILLIKR